MVKITMFHGKTHSLFRLGHGFSSELFLRHYRRVLPSEGQGLIRLEVISFDLERLDDYDDNSNMRDAISTGKKKHQNSET